MPSLHCSRMPSSRSDRSHTAGHRLVPISIVGFLLLFGIGLWSQQTTADVLGTVMDMLVGVWPGVKITVHNWVREGTTPPPATMPGITRFPDSRLGATV